jgi:tRNA1Val (adenine37-N6)-methyltransferase
LKCASFVPSPRLPADELTDGGLLGGRVRYAQPRHGFRSGIEPVLLAASIPALRNDRVLEGGSGAGATLLCLAARVTEVQAVGVEQDAALVGLAQQNAAANCRSALAFMAADIARLPPLGAFDHACANPPYHPDGGTPSPDDARRTAKQAPDGLLGIWAAALARDLRPRGTLTFVMPASRLPEAIAAFAAAQCRPTAALPLWPKAGEPAKLLLLRGVKNGRSPFRLLPGLVLHDAEGRFTPEADAILRDGKPLPL